MIYDYLRMMGLSDDYDINSFLFLYYAFRIE